MVRARPLGSVAYAVEGPAARALMVREARLPDAPKPRLLDRVRAAVRARHYSRRTEESYVAWIRRYILFHDKRHPMEMGGPEVRAVLQGLDGIPHLMACLLYGAGLRVLECRPLPLHARSPISEA